MYRILLHVLCSVFFLLYLLCVLLCCWWLCAVQPVSTEHWVLYSVDVDVVRLLLVRSFETSEQPVPLLLNVTTLITMYIHTKCPTRCNTSVLILLQDHSSCNKIKILVLHLVGHFVCIYIEDDARNHEPKTLITSIFLRVSNWTIPNYCTKSSKQACV
jgi:hypothetical protein